MEHLRWLFWIYFLHALAVAWTRSVKKVSLEISQNSQENTKKRRKTLWQIDFLVNFVKFIRTLFLTDYLQWLLLCMSYPILYPFSHILPRPLAGYLPFHFPVEIITKWTHKTYIYLIYPLLQILFKKFIFKCESSSYLLNFLSWFLANLKTKFYTRILLVHLT